MKKGTVLKCIKDDGLVITNAIRKGYLYVVRKDCSTISSIVMIQDDRGMAFGFYSSRFIIVIEP